MMLDTDAHEYANLPYSAREAATNSTYAPRTQSEDPTRLVMLGLRLERLALQSVTTSHLIPSLLPFTSVKAVTQVA